MAEVPISARRLGFAGTPEFAATILSALLDAGIRPHLILTQPDRRRGRGRKLKPSAVKRLAQVSDLPVHQPGSLKTSESQKLIESVDLLIVAAYGLLLPPAVLSLPDLGCINVHASLLPRWRGAAPIERAIMAGDTETGITLMQMDEGLDTGDIIVQARCPILPEMTGKQLHDTLAALGSRVLLDSLDQLSSLPRTPQPERGVTYAAKLTPEDAVIDWTKSSRVVVDQIRALNDRLPAFSYLHAPTSQGAYERVRILSASITPSAEPTCTNPGTIVNLLGDRIRVQTGGGCIDILELQLERGKGRVMTAKAALNGYSGLFTTGAFFSSVQNEI